MTTFASAVRGTPVRTTTTNGMAAYTSTNRANTDLFGQLGASRGKDITNLFAQALAENPEYAIRIALWGRDIRGGAGERKLFRDILLQLEKSNPRYLLETNLLNRVPELGRFDDLLIFTNPEVKFLAFSIIRNALESKNGLAAKWMPRKGATAVELRKFLGWSPKFYRKTLVSLTNVVETQMCAREFERINFSHVPSLAMSRYTKAFAKQAPIAFTTFKEKLVKGDKTVKVNAAAVYPYDIIKNLRSSRDTQLVDAQWNALPNFIGDANVLPLVDVSGSMTCSAGGSSAITCLDVAISLGLYCSGKNTGKFKDVFLTFSTSTEFVTVRGSLSERYNTMARSNWDMSTNLELALKKILTMAVSNGVPQSEMPGALLIMSDMQFNAAIRSPSATAIEMIRNDYIRAGYTPPAVIFWNINASGNSPVKYDTTGTALISGFSPAIMKSVLSADLKNMTPEGVMLKTIMADKYDFR
jgi:hypothetical protein